jgi:hypothetical protein
MSDLTTTLAVLKGQAESLKQAKTILDQGSASLASLQVATSTQIQETVAALQGLDTVGYYSSVDQLLRAERFAGKAASVDYIKANPACAEADAIAAWDAAGLAATGLPVLLQDTANLAAVYRVNLVAGGYIAEPTWEAQRAWIVATDKTIILGA